MRYLYLDQFEIDDPASEQTLAIAIAHEARFDSFETFYRATNHLPHLKIKERIELPSPIFASDTQHGDKLFRFIESETELRLRGDTPLYALSEEWNYFDLMLKVDNYFARVVWFMTA